MKGTWHQGYSHTWQELIVEIASGHYNPGLKDLNRTIHENTLNDSNKGFFRAASCDFVDGLFGFPLTMLLNSRMIPVILL